MTMISSWMRAESIDESNEDSAYQRIRRSAVRRPLNFNYEKQYEEILVEEDSGEKEGICESD
jgi:hypothetical protein